MKPRKLKTRKDKIRFLRDLKVGNTNINEISLPHIEIWKMYEDAPDLYINEITAEEISVAQMQEKRKLQGDDLLFLTVYSKPRHG